jgi:hypothetical protein
MPLGLLDPLIGGLGPRLLGVIDRLPSNPDVTDLERIWQDFIHLGDKPDVVLARSEEHTSELQSHLAL